MYTLYRPFGLLGVCYVIAIALLFCRSGAGDGYFAATRPLPVNHRIIAADVRAAGSLAFRLGFNWPDRPPIEGKYLTVPIAAAGTRIGGTMIADQPNLWAPSWLRVLVLPTAIDPHLLALVDAGSAVWVLGLAADAKPVPAILRAIICDTPRTGAPACYPIVAIEADQSDAVTKSLQSARLAPRSAPPEEFMTLPIWRKIVSELAVPDPGRQWRVALEALTPGRLIKIEVVVDQHRIPPITGRWRPQGFVRECSADGDFDLSMRGNVAQSGTPVVASAPVGALIGRIGGSTADQTADTPPANPPSRILFSIGRQCVIMAPNPPIGSLYLGVNDDPTRMAAVKGQLLVNVYEAV